MCCLGEGFLSDLLRYSHGVFECVCVCVAGTSVSGTHGEQLIRHTHTHTRRSPCRCKDLIGDKLLASVSGSEALQSGAFSFIGTASDGSRHNDATSQGNHSDSQHTYEQ